MLSDHEDQRDVAITVSAVSKCFQIYDKPQDRLKQSILPRIRRLLGLQPSSYCREFWALTNVSFSLKKGETLGIIGRNGSGKSTLLQLICGTLSPSAGEIQTFGRVAALLELGAGFNPEFTGRENVYLSAAFYGLSHEQTNARIESILQFAEINEFIDQPVKTYSSGMFVRLAFATIAHVDADILIIDEALAVGDAVFTQKCMRFLRQFKMERTLLFVSHDSSSVVALCDKALWLSSGKMMKLGNAKETCENYLTHIMGAFDLSSEEVEEGSKRDLQQLRAIWADEKHYVSSKNFGIFKSNIDMSAQLGPQGAEISLVSLTSEHGNEVRSLKGGEIVILTIHATAYRNLTSPILGFFVKDRLGQYLFGSNTLSKTSGRATQAKTGQGLTATFTFPMPWLAQGDYSIQVALADGDQRDHEQHHWIHDAIVFHSSNDPAASGLVGIPMLAIQLNIHDETGR